MPKLRIITEGATLEFENDSVANVADLLRETAGLLNISASANIAVNGAPASASTPLADGDEVTTTKPAGRKGK
jgi:molybdopterin converting factor small subunit